MRAERIILAAALIAGVSYTFSDRFDTTTPLMIAWKGAGVGLLALWCVVQARSRDGWLIAAVIAFGSLGDVLLEAVGLRYGAGAFAIGHLIAIVLYRSNSRSGPSGSQVGLAGSVAVLTPLLGWLLTGAVSATIYAASLGIMAAAAWLSRFPRYRVGIGAMLFVASDLLIFARLGPLSTSAWAGFLIWPLYFAGQALIAIGVVRTIDKDQAEKRAE